MVSCLYLTFSSVEHKRKCLNTHKPTGPFVSQLVMSRSFKNIFKINQHVWVCEFHTKTRRTMLRMMQKADFKKTSLARLVQLFRDAQKMRCLNYAWNNMAYRTSLLRCKSDLFFTEWRMEWVSVERVSAEHARHDTERTQGTARSKR